MTNCNDYCGEEKRKTPRDEFDQPLPTKNDNPIIQELVMDDMQKRLEIGIQRYGTGLQANNGRNMTKDLYEELLDACVYVRGLLFEKEGK